MKIEGEDAAGHAALDNYLRLARRLKELHGEVLNSQSGMRRILLEFEPLMGELIAIQTELNRRGITQLGHQGLRRQADDIVSAIEEMRLISERIDSAIEEIRRFIAAMPDNPKK